MNVDRKPLKLDVYPKGIDHHREPCYMSLDGSQLFMPIRYAEMDAECKRFKDAELAAEYHASEAAHLQEVTHLDVSGISFGELDRENQKARVFRRFATTPHYSDDETFEEYADRTLDYARKTLDLARDVKPSKPYRRRKKPE